MTGLFSSIFKNSIEPKYFTLLSIFFLGSVGVWGQSGNVIISVTDFETGNSLPAAHIQYSETGSDITLFAITDLNGQAKIETGFPVTVTVSYIGFEKVQDTINSSGQISIKLKANINALNEIVITGELDANDSRASIYNVKVITKKEIQDKAATNLQELLGTELSSSLSQDNILGSSVSLQGLGGEKIQVLVNGIPILGRVNGNIDISQINLNNVDRVEIIEGPMSVIYGSDAIGGVINIITDENLPGKLDIGLNTYLENVGVTNIDGYLGFGIKNHFIEASGGRNLFRGWKYNDSSRSVRWKPKEEIFADLMYKWGNQNHTVQFENRYYQEEILNRMEPGNYPFVIAYDEYYKTFRNAHSLKYKAWFRKYNSLEIIGSYSHYKRQKNRFIKDLTNLETLLTTQEGDQDTLLSNEYRIKGIYVFNDPNRVFQYQSGFDFSYETAYGKRIENGNQYIGDYAGFLSFVYKPVSEISIQPALRVIHNTSYKAPLIPSLHFKYELNKKLVLKASYGKGFRAPSLKELHFYFVDVNHNILGNKELKAEHSNSYQLGFDYLIRMDDHNFRVEFKSFYNDVKNEIKLITYDDDLYQYQNIAKTKTLGGSISVRYNFKGFSAKTGFQTTGVRYFYSDSVKSDKYYYTPTAVLGINYRIKPISTTVNLDYKFNGMAPVLILNDLNEIEEGIFESYHLLDISLNRSFFGDKLFLAIGTKNLFDVTDLQSNSSITGSTGVHTTGVGSMPINWGRSFYINAKFSISKK